MEGSPCCPACGLEILTGVLHCPRCRAPLTEAGQAAATPADPAGSSFPAPTAVAGPRRWASWVGIGLVVILLVVWKARPVYFPTDLVLQPVTAGQADPCRGKPRCVVVTTAPWCPACQSAIPHLQEIAKRWAPSREVGLKVVLVRDEDTNLRALATALGPGVSCWLDPSSRLMARLGARGVPHWFVVDVRGRVVKDQSGVYLDTDAQLEALGFGARR